MERRRNQRVRVQSSDVAIGTGVFAPSNVQSPNRSAQNAAALSNALGFASDVVIDQTVRKQDSDIEAGSQAALQGDVSEETLRDMERSAAFVFGAEKVLAKQRIIVDSAAATEFYQTQFDKNKSLPELRAELDAFWKDRYENVSTGIAREIAPLMAETSGRLLQAHATFQQQQTHNQLTDAQGTILRNALDNGITPDIWQGIRQEGSGVIGKDAMNALAVDTIDLFARENLDETIWDSPEFKMLKENPRFREAIAKSRSDVKDARIAAAEQASFAEQGKDLAILGELADAGDPGFLRAIGAFSKPDATGATRLETTAQVQSMWSRYLNGVSGGKIDSVADNLWAQGSGQDLKPADRDGAATRDAARVAQNVIDGGGTSEQASQIGLDYLIDRSVVNNHMPDSLKEQIESSPRNPQKFRQTVEMFDQFEAELPGFFGNNVDPDVTRDVLLFKRMVGETGNEQAALDAITDNNRALWDNLSEQQKTAARTEVVEQLRDGIFLTTNGIDETNRLDVMVGEDIEYYVTRGLPLEQAVQAAVTNLDPSKGRFVAVDGNLYRSGEGWENSPGGPDQVIEFSKEQFAENEDIKTWLGNPDTDDIVILPVPNKPGFVRITLKGTLQTLSASPPIPITDLNDDFQVELDRLSVVADLAADEKAESDAIESLFPVPARTEFDEPELFKFILEERQRRWTALTPEQRIAHIGREKF